MFQKSLHILLLLLLAFHVAAKDSVDDDNLPDLLLGISDDVYYNFTDAIDKVDSIKGTLSEKQYNEHKPYFFYFDAYKAYRSFQYDLALNLGDSAITYFLWNEDAEWQARCVLVMAFTAELLMLDNHALSYYETSMQMTNYAFIKGIALLGIARSKKRLKEDYVPYLDEAVELLDETNIKELRLLSKRSYYSFNSKDENLVPELLKVERTYNSLGYGLFASVTNKQISNYYKNIEEYIKAEEYALKAISQIEKTRDSISVFSGSLLLFYSGILLENGVYDVAKEYINNAILINDTLNVGSSNLYAFIRLASINRLQEDYKAADISSQNALRCQREMSSIKKSSSALLAEVLINREYIDGELHKSKIYQYIRLSLLVILSLVFFRGLINRFRRQVEAKDVEVGKLQEDNTVLQKNAIEMLSIVKKLEQESSLVAASEDFEKRIKNDVELSSSIPDDFCNAYQKNISAFSFKHTKLSPAEVRTSVMLAMNIPSKSIVKLQCIESDTLKTYRKRIRRKLDLDSGVDLNVYLKTLLYDLG